MADLLTPALLEAINNKFTAEHEGRELSFLEKARYELEVMKFRDALRLSEQREHAEHVKQRKQHERKFVTMRKLLMKQRGQEWEAIVQDFRRKYLEIPKDDKEQQLDFILTLYNKYYFSPTLIGNIVNRSAQVVWSTLEEYAFEN
jgi:hypothetical protein